MPRDVRAMRSRSISPQPQSTTRIMMQLEPSLQWAHCHDMRGDTYATSSNMLVMLAPPKTSDAHVHAPEPIEAWIWVFEPGCCQPCRCKYLQVLFKMDKSGEGQQVVAADLTCPFWRAPASVCISKAGSSLASLGKISALSIVHVQPPHV